MRDPVALLLATTRGDSGLLAAVLEPWTRADLLAPFLVAAVDPRTRATRSAEAFEELLAETARELATGAP